MSEYRFTNAFPYLLTRVGVRMGEVFAGELAEAGMTLHMYRVLAALWEKDDQRLVDLAEMVSSEVSSLSRLIGRMIKLDFVRRERLESDARTVHVSLTPTGRQTVERWIPRAMRYDEIATHGFSEDEVVLLKGMLTRVFGNLREHAPLAASEGKTMKEISRANVRTHQPLRTQRIRRAG